jgi:hypothetical protein
MHTDNVGMHVILRQRKQKQTTLSQNFQKTLTQNPSGKPVTRGVYGPENSGPAQPEPDKKARKKARARPDKNRSRPDPTQARLLGFLSKPSPTRARQC